MPLWIRRLLEVGSLVIETVNFVQEVVGVIDNVVIKNRGKELIDKWKALFPKQVQKAEELRLTGKRK